MAKTKIISYFNHVTDERYVSSSMTQLALKIGVHRNTLSGWLLETGYYIDSNIIVFSTDNKNFIKGLPTFKRTIVKKDTQKNVQSTPLNAQPPVVGKNNNLSNAWKEAREELKQDKKK